MTIREAMRTWLRRAGVVVLFLLVLELCARLDDWIRWGAPWWGPYSHAVLLVDDERGRHGRPYARFEKWQLNSHGFCGPEITMAKPEGVVRIAVAGASETFGLSESPGMEYPGQMQQLLEAEAPGRYQVLNTANVGMTLPRVIQELRAWTQRFEPDVLIVLVAPISYLYGTAPSFDPPADRPAPALEDHVRVYRKAKIILRRIIPTWIQADLREAHTAWVIRQHEPGWVWEEPPAERVALLRGHLEMLISEARSCGVQTVLVTHPSHPPDSSGRYRALLARMRDGCPRPSEACLVRTEMVVNRLIQELGKEHGIPVVDLAGILAKDRENFADMFHFTDQGAREVASALVTQILSLRSDRTTSR